MRLSLSYHWAFIDSHDALMEILWGFVEVSRCCHGLARCLHDALWSITGFHEARMEISWAFMIPSCRFHGLPWCAHGAFVRTFVEI